MRRDVKEKSDIVNLKIPETWAIQEENLRMLRQYDHKTNSLQEEKQMEVEKRQKLERVKKFLQILDTAKEARISHEKERENNKWFKALNSKQ